MALTTKELCERLLQIYDEVSLLEMLNITGEELLERFEDKVEEKFDVLEREVTEDNYEEETDEH